MLKFQIKERITKRILFIFFIILCLVFMFTNVDIALMIFISAVFACSLNPIVNKLENKIPRPVATGLVLLGTLIILGVLITFIFALGAYQFYELIKELPNYIANIDDTIRNIPLLQKIGITKLDTDGILTSITNSSERIVDYGVQFAGGIGTGFIYALTSLIFIFFFIQDKDSIKKTVLSYFPPSIKERTEEIMNNIGEKIGGYIIAQTMAVSSVFIFNLVFLLMFNIPYAISMAIMTAILDIVPVIGPAIAISICLIWVSDASIKTILLTLIITCLAQLFENNVVRPMAFSKLMNLHPTIIFLSLVLGAKYFGFLGVLFGPAMAATICILLNELYIRNIN